MKKDKVKTKGQGKELGNTGRGQVVKLKSAKAKSSWTTKKPQVAHWWNTAVAFVSEAWQELKKVTWPGRRETVSTTIVVIILVFLISGYLGLVDMGLSALLKKVMRG
jgi:preprotein translocase subunit SecE